LVCTGLLFFAVLFAGSQALGLIHTAWTMATSGTKIPEKGHRRIKGKNKENKEEKKLEEKTMRSGSRAVSWPLTQDRKNNNMQSLTHRTLP